MLMETTAAVWMDYATAPIAMLVSLTMFKFEEASKKGEPEGSPVNAASILVRTDTSTTH
jgi:hypothetical protein